jgi:hypothetical protein
MPIVSHCPACGITFQIPDNFPAPKAACPKCHATFELRDGSPIASQPLPPRVAPRVANEPAPVQLHDEEFHELWAKPVPAQLPGKWRTAIAASLFASSIVAAFVGITTAVGAGVMTGLANNQPSKPLDFIHGTWVTCFVMIDVLRFGGIFALLFFVYRAHKNLSLWGTKSTEFTPGNAVACFFIPVANLVFPCQVFQELWRGSNPDAPFGTLAWKRQGMSVLVGFWWAAWILTNIALAISSAIGEMFQILGLMLWLLTALLTVVTLWHIRQLQQARFYRFLVERATHLEGTVPEPVSELMPRLVCFAACVVVLLAICGMGGVLGATIGTQKGLFAQAVRQANPPQPNPRPVFQPQPVFQPAPPVVAVADPTIAVPELPRLAPLPVARLEKDRVSRQMEGKVSEIVAGGNGRYLILLMPELRKLTVFDVTLAQVVYHIDVAEDVRFAASYRKLVLVSGRIGSIERYDLVTGKKEKEVDFDERIKVTDACMGPASNGPLLLLLEYSKLGRAALFDLDTLEPMNVEWMRQQTPHGTLSTPGASADGRLFVMRKGPFSEVVGSFGIELTDGKLIQHTTGDIGNILRPSADGKVIYSAKGIYECGACRLEKDRLPYRPYFPAVQGDYYVGLEPDINDGPGNVSIFRTGQQQGCARLEKIPGVRYEDKKLQPPHDQRVHLIASAKVLVTLDNSCDRLWLCRVELPD